MSKSDYYLYMLRCADGSLYTGIAIDVQKRFKKHISGTGAKYLRSRLPAKLVHTQGPYSGRAEAMKHELAVKKLPKKKKELLAQS